MIATPATFSSPRWSDSGQARRGSALLLVLWAILLLGLAVLVMGALVDRGARQAVSTESAVQARCLALSGVALGFQPSTRPDSSWLRQRDEQGQLDIQIGSEGGRLNLNELLARGHPEVLRRLFLSWGSDARQVDATLNALQRWGLEDRGSGLPGAAAGVRRPFRTLQQVRGVLGMEEMMRQNPHWQDSLTLWSDGRLNLNTASAETLAAFFGMPESQAADFVRQRNGPDGVAGTLDDQLLGSARAVRDKLGVSEEAFNGLAELISYEDGVRRVVSTGAAGSRRCTITAIASPGHMPWHFYLWSED